MPDSCRLVLCSLAGIATICHSLAMQDSPNQTLVAALLSPYYLVVPLVGIVLGGKQCRRALVISSAEVGQTVQITTTAKDEQSEAKEDSDRGSASDEQDEEDILKDARRFMPGTSQTVLPTSKIDELSTVMEQRLVSWNPPPDEKLLDPPLCCPTSSTSFQEDRTAVDDSLGRHAIIRYIGVRVRRRDTRAMLALFRRSHNYSESYFLTAQNERDYTALYAKSRRLRPRAR